MALRGEDVTGALPLPACGERAGVRGSNRTHETGESDGALTLPLTLPLLRNGPRPLPACGARE
jgi:hypothetical protein